jgi:fatty acid desaturase
MDIEFRDLEGFGEKLKQIGKEAESNTTKVDYYHMRLIELMGRVSFLVAIVACYHKFFILSTLFLTWSLMVKWLLMHHIGHGGYNKIVGIPARYHSRNYGIGWRRFIDWFDWIKPEAWNYEHNFLHHYFTGEDKDPDLVEENLSWLAESKVPQFLKVMILFFFAVTWKFTYYSARTLSFQKGYNKVDFSNFFNIAQKSQRVMWLELFIPYVLFNFVILPLGLEYLFQIGEAYLYCRVVAELLHNLHMFIVIVPNHSGDDLYRFGDIEASKRGGVHFYIRQILGSANYNCGPEWLDLSQMYLNYQIEHHIFPSLSMRQYRLVQPKVKALCKEYGIPYIQESVWIRLYKMTSIAIGRTRMLA